MYALHLRYQQKSFYIEMLLSFRVGSTYNILHFNLKIL